MRREPAARTRARPASGSSSRTRRRFVPSLPRTRTFATVYAEMEREAIVARLREIAALLELHGGNKFKTRAFARGARALEASREPLETLVGEGRLVDLPGIGVALSRQI